MENITLTSLDEIKLEAAIHLTHLAPSTGTVVLAHGITGDMHEGGLFVRLAENLSQTGFNVLRFSFRGHGGSAGAQRGVTIAGEMLDLQASLDLAATRFDDAISVVAFSFGAVSASLSLPYIENKLKSLVFWNPVLDLEQTFIHSNLPWGKANFNEDAIQGLYSRGYLLLDGSFEIGRVLYQEMKRYDPYADYIKSTIPSIIIHADKDTHVPYSVSRHACRNRKNCDFFTIKDSDHVFDTREREAEVIAITTSWLQNI